MKAVISLTDILYNLYPVQDIPCTASINGCDSYYTTGCGYDTESSTLLHTENVLDKEGNTVDKRTVVDACFVYHIQFAIGEKYFSFRHYDDFFKWFDTFIAAVKADSISRETKPKMIIWVANFAHEWAFMKNYIQGGRYEISKIFSKSRRDVLLVELESCIQFREAIGLFGHSLADISKNWCTKYVKMKGDLDYNKVRTFNTPITARERRYMQNDVFILTEMHTAIFAAYTRSNGVIYIPYTTSGFVRLRLKERIEADEGLTAARENLGGKWLEKSNVQLLKKRNYSIFTNAADWNLLRSYAFAGGSVGSNICEVGKELHGVKCADITSDYPYQMLSQDFPQGKIETGHLKEWEECKTKGLPWFALLYINELTANTHHAFLSEHKIINHKHYGLDEYKERHGLPKDAIVNNGKLLHAKNLVCVMNDVDYDIYNRAYNLEGVVLLKLWYFPWGYKKLPQWLRDCVIEDYITKSKLKEQGKEAQKTVEYRDSKARVNTYFGTLATRPDDIYNALDETALFTPEKEFTFEDLRRNTWLNPYWAFYITSYARRMLIQYIIKYPDSVVQYDTDSLYYKTNKQGLQLEKELEEFNRSCKAANVRRFKHLDNSQYLTTLGTWDFDEQYNRFLCLGAKKYIKEEQNGDIVTVIAGLPKQAIPKEIRRYRVKHIFSRYNPVYLDADVIIKHLFTNKFASAYDDRMTTTYTPIKDYKGETVLQPVSSYHALIPIDFTLSVAPEYLKLIRRFQKVKQLK